MVTSILVIMYDFYGSAYIVACLFPLIVSISLLFYSSTALQTNESIATVTTAGDRFMPDVTSLKVGANNNGPVDKDGV